jgi:5,10-methylenetetrahydromethanopterin reductase
MSMAAPPRLGISCDGADSIADLRSLVAAAEAAGATTVWIASHLFHREPIATAAMTLADTRKIGIVLMAISPYTVHPVHAAMAAATLDEYFPGRVELCFGMGAPRDLEAAGVVAEQPLQTLREAMAVARALLAGETIAFAGRRFHVQGRRLVTGARTVPIWLAASGPKMLALAGEAADGALISAATSPEFIRWSLDHVRQGEERAGRTVRKAALVFCSVATNARAAHDRLRRKLAHILRGQHHARNLELAGAALDQARLASAFAREEWDEVDALVSDEVVCRVAASGAPAEVSDRLAAYRAIGVDEIVAHGLRDAEEVTSVLAAMRA